MSDPKGVYAADRFLLISLSAAAAASLVAGAVLGSVYAIGVCFAALSLLCGVLYVPPWPFWRRGPHTWVVDVSAKEQQGRDALAKFLGKTLSSVPTADRRKKK